MRIDSTVSGGLTKRSSRFVLHTGVIPYALSGLVTGERERKFMKQKIKYTNEPMGKLRIIDDFLPPPDQLALKEDNIKVTISLSRSSLNFFKEEAQVRNTSYQQMIRRIIDLYATHYKDSR